MKVLVTGASRGIGKEVAKKFKEQGYDVYSPSRQELDLLNNSSIEQYIEANKETGFDVIINNAGINDINYIDMISNKEIEEMFQTNLIGPIKLLRGLVEPMKQKQYGRIVNVGSIWAVVSKEKRSIYSATKNGLHGITNALAIELAPYNILVNTICPGFTMTELTKKNNSPEQIEIISKEIPLGRMAQPVEMAEMIYFFGSVYNTYVTGQKIIVDGGYSVR